MIVNLPERMTYRPGSGFILEFQSGRSEHLRERPEIERHDIFAELVRCFNAVHGKKIERASAEAKT